MFTTKAPGEGTGFGLAIVAGIAEQAGGAIELRSTPGRGTEVELLLPRSDHDGTPADRSPAALIAEAAGRGESILLVEDDDGVRDLTRRILIAEGFQVFDAAGAAEALALDAEHNGEFHVVLTDNTMPDTSGIELLGQLRAIRAGAPAIVMSGFVAEPSAVAPAGPAITWLQKPFGASGLLAAVSAALRRAPA
jgi:CheY-like chemotaxis protein